MSKIETDKDKDTGVVDYVTFEAEINKNKISNDLRKFHLPFYVNPDCIKLGLDDSTAVMDYLIDKKVLKQLTLQSFEVNGESMTRNKMRLQMLKNEDFYKSLRGMVINHYLNERGFTPGV